MFLKQSTSAVVLVGPVLDASGVAVTTAVIGDFTLSKNGTSAAMAGNTISHSHNGHYAITLTSGNTDTIGRLTISVNNTAQAMPVFRWDICQPTVYDALFTNAVNTTGGIPAATGAISALAGSVSTYAGGDTAGTTTLLTRLPSAITLTAGRVTANTDQWGGVTVTGMPMPTYTQPTGFLAATFPATVSSFAGGAVASVSGSVGSVTSPVTVGTNNDKTGYSLTVSPPTADAIADAVWDEIMSTHTVNGSYGSHVVRSANQNQNTVAITGSQHIASVVHDVEPAAIPEDAFVSGAVSARVLATDAAAEVATSVRSELAVELGRIDATVGSRATASDMSTLLSRLGAFTGSGVNTVLGLLRAIMSKAASTPSDVGGTFSSTTDSIEAIRDAQQAGTGDASQATLEAVQDTVDAIAASLSGTPIEVVGRVADGGSITLYAGDDMRVRSGTEISVTITDVGGAIYSRLHTIGVANLAFGASRPSQPAGAIDGTVAALSQAGAGAAQTVTIDIEITDGGQSLAYADNYVWQIVSSRAQGSEYDTYTEIEGSLAVRRRVAVPVHA